MSAVLLAALAFLLLGLATDAHHRRRFGTLPGADRRRWLRIASWVAMVASAVPAIAAQGAVFGPVLWSGAVMAGAAIAFLALNLLPARR
ncbi:DUF3325 domain-containing protein [Sphingomonas rubra]|uniref:DUF3325 domain-containing protein n=1 Tax=Sphingomonas rubra TaxID=634430 RepID=A0A1I5RQN0_9SPHN|nr:DUF3325 domain-containing protein [Sphingomonas rubra]SFP60864.1 Protein of unknown function [Sphingomonas rubra]